MERNGYGFEDVLRVVLVSYVTAQTAACPPTSLLSLSSSSWLCIISATTFYTGIMEMLWMRNAAAAGGLAFNGPDYGRQHGNKRGAECGISKEIFHKTILYK